MNPEEALKALSRFYHASFRDAAAYRKRDGGMKSTTEEKRKSGTALFVAIVGCKPTAEETQKIVDLGNI